MYRFGLEGTNKQAQIEKCLVHTKCNPEILHFGMHS